MRWLRSFVLAALAAGAVLATPLGAQSCWPRFGDTPETARLAGGFQLATLVLLVVPWALVGAGAWWITRRARDGIELREW